MWKGEGWGQGTHGIKDGHHGLSGPYTTGRKAGNLKEVGLGWINGGRKDRMFGLGKIRDGGEQLF